MEGVCHLIAVADCRLLVTKVALGPTTWVQPQVWEMLGTSAKSRRPVAKPLLLPLDSGRS